MLKADCLQFLQDKYQQPHKTKRIKKPKAEVKQQLLMRTKGQVIAMRYGRVGSRRVSKVPLTHIAAKLGVHYKTVWLVLKRYRRDGFELKPPGK